ncbi:MAG: hypothetical protein V3U96_06405 [Paracoccaceae bacterium]
MISFEKIDKMAAEISANIERLEQQLSEEYDRFILNSPELDVTVIGNSFLKPNSASDEIEEYEPIAVVDRLFMKLDTKISVVPNHIAAQQADMDVVKQYTADRVRYN